VTTAGGTRADPFADVGDTLDLSDFRPAPASRPAVPKEAVKKASEANNFPSRAAPTPPVAASNPARPAQRRHRTGRNVQFNTKVTRDVADRYAALAEKSGLVYGELLEIALERLEALPNLKR
jgi:hypothetical protein